MSTSGWELLKRSYSRFTKCPYQGRPGIRDILITVVLKTEFEIFEIFTAKGA